MGEVVLAVNHLWVQAPIFGSISSQPSDTPWNAYRANTPATGRKLVETSAEAAIADGGRCRLWNASQERKREALGIPYLQGIPANSSRNKVARGLPVS